MKKNILITGAGSGIGKDSAIALAQRGHTVFATTRTETSAKEMNDLAKEKDLPITSFELDITNSQQREKILHLEIDVLINNAGIGESGSLSEIPIERIRKNFEVNVFAALELTQLALRNMMEKDAGTVIFISSLAGRITMPFFGSYCMTKYSLSSGAEILRNELKQLNKKVYVSVVEPGGYHTGFNQEVMATKYTWMDEKSYFHKMIDKIRKAEQRQFKFTESKTTHSIVNKIITAAEVERPRFRYTAPWWQSFGVRIIRMFGK